MTNKLFVIIIISAMGFGQSTDSLITQNPKKAALWSILPGGGQLYNKKYFKAAVIITLESLAISESIKKGNDYKLRGSNADLNDRNEYAWWALFVHVYGTLDAVVDSHLKPFKKIMSDESFDEEIEIKEEVSDGK